MVQTAENADDAKIETSKSDDMANIMTIVYLHFGRLYTIVSRKIVAKTVKCSACFFFMQCYCF